MQPSKHKVQASAKDTQPQIKWLLSGKATNSIARSHPCYSTFYNHTSSSFVTLIDLPLLSLDSTLCTSLSALRFLVITDNCSCHTSLSSRSPDTSTSPTNAQLFSSLDTISWSLHTSDPGLHAQWTCRNPLRPLSVLGESDNHLQPHVHYHRYRATISPSHHRIVKQISTGPANPIPDRAA